MSSFGRKTWVLSWCLYDFANSSYSAIITSVVFPVYYVMVVVGNAQGHGDLWWGRAISLSMAFVALSSPFLGGLADYGGFRKRLLILYTLLSVAATGMLASLGPGMAMAGFVLVVLANTGMEGALVFYNAFLNDIAAQEYRGRVSAWGFGIGYLGSLVSLLVAFPLVQGGHYQWLWLFCASFFLVFSLPAFFLLPADRRTGALEGRRVFLEGFFKTVKTLSEMVRQRNMARFLVAFFFYMDGVNTVIVFSSIFASTTLLFETKELIFLFMVVQFTAFSGSMIMARPIDRWGAKRVIVLSLVLWCAVAVASCFVYTKASFFLIAAVAGTGLGSVQAASRTLFAGFIPPGKDAEYFGVYSFMGKTSSILGPLIFGSLSVFFKSQRPAVASIALFFIAGLVLIAKVREKPLSLQEKKPPLLLN